MSPAGAGVRAFRTHTNKPAACTFLVIIGLACLVLLVPGSNQARAHNAPIAAISPSWAVFGADCEQGPSPGQGNTQSACECWETNLEAAAIQPDYAVDVINAAQVGGGAAYTVPENIGNVAVATAMQGCDLYPQTP